MARQDGPRTRSPFVADCSRGYVRDHWDMTTIRLGNGAALGIMLTLLAGCSNSPISPSPSLSLETGPSSTPGSTSMPTPTPESTAAPSPVANSTPVPAPTSDTGGVVTRIVISALRIDLPVVTLPANGVHYCNVAMWWPYPRFVQPGNPGSVYLLAHARAGMFLPLLEASLVNGGRSLLGAKVQLYTNADWVFTYTVSQVRRHISSSGTTRLAAPLAAAEPELWLQTSEGATTASPLLQVVAKLMNARPADHVASHPSPRPTICS
jgi:hypothetical protein